jgi:hypothetical protein
LIDLCASGSQLHDTIANLDNVGKADFVKTRGKAKPGDRCGHC